MSEFDEGPMYKCPRCGAVSPRGKWERTEHTFKCPECNYRVGKKIRPPIIRRVKAV